MAASIAAISPLTPYSKFEEDDNWNTPAPSTTNSPLPEKCCDLPDYDPTTSRRNHSRSKDYSQWNTSSYPKQASPLVELQPRPKPVRLATPNTGYPFPYVLSRPSTPLEQPSSTSNSTSDDSSSSSSSSSSSRIPSSSFSDSSSSSSTPSSQCSTPQDDPPIYQSQATTPHEVQQRRTKNAASTPGAPPPMGFIGTGHASSYLDYEDVKTGSGSGKERDDEEEEERETTPKKTLSNPLLKKLQGLSVDNSSSSH
ncbi:hypothetical protein JCM3765_002058 [Sporobolomyces pararoseus]